MRCALRPPAVLLLALLPVASCGDEPAVVEHAVVEHGEAASEAPATEPLSRLERLRLQLATCVAVGGPGAEAKAREIAQELLDTCDPDDEEVRRLLGWTDFQADVLGRRLARFEDPIPEAIANRRGYPFLDAVVDLNARRWLRDPAEIERAHAAVAAMREHRRRLETDRLYRLGDARRANLAIDPHLEDHGTATAWRPPHLVCFVRGESLSEFDLRKVTDWRRRRQVRAAFEARSRALGPHAERAARVLAQLYAEFLRRYGERHDLRPLDAPFGGRPELGPRVRSFEDGVALTVLVFADQRAYQAFHLRHLGGPRRPGDRGYYDPRTGRIVTYDPGTAPEDRDQYVRTLLRLGTYQLLDWFTRQRSRWGRSAVGQECIGAGLAGCLSGVRIGEDLALEFTGIDVDLLDGARSIAAALAERDRAYPLRPLRELLGITSYAELGASRFADDAVAPDPWSPTSAPLALYFQQSWMLVRFLQEHDAGRYREGFARYLDAYLERETQHGNARDVFMRCLGIQDEDWSRLDTELRAFVEDDVLKREAR